MKKILILLCIITISACSKNDASDLETQNMDSEKFLQSVAFNLSLDNTKSNKLSENSNKKIINLKINNFNPNLTLEKAYIFNGVTFNDDGKYNDQIAGDNIYTSVQEVNVDIKKGKNLKNNITITDDSFAYNNELNSMKGGSVDGSAGVSCGISHGDCPSDGGFWDSDWGTGWGCFGLKDDCVGTIELSFSFDW